MTKSSRDLRRLKEDESYLETLAHIFSHTGGKEKALFTKGGGYGKSSKKLEESGWDLSMILIFKNKEKGWKERKKNLAIRGIEPVTFALLARRSNQLS